MHRSQSLGLLRRGVKNKLRKARSTKQDGFGLWWGNASRVSLESVDSWSSGRERVGVECIVDNDELDHHGSRGADEDGQPNSEDIGSDGDGKRDHAKAADGQTVQSQSVPHTRPIASSLHPHPPNHESQ